MSPRFLVVVTGCFLGLTVASGLVLVLVEPARGGTVTFIGVQGLAFMVFLRAVLVAAVPQADPARAASSLRRRQRWTAAGLLVGAITVAVGLALALDPLVAAVACVLTVGGLVLLVRALDRYAGRTARRRPVDAVRPGDEDRLAPAAIHATLLRRANLGLVTGALVASLVGPLVGYFGSGAVAGIVAGLAALALTVGLVVILGSLDLTLAAGRRLNALVSEDPARMKRLQKAVLRRRTADLDDTDHAEAVRWAHVAEPAFMLQGVAQLAVFVMVPGFQTAQLISDPDDVFRRWLVGGLVVVLVPLYSVVLRQWLRVRHFARRADGTRTAREAC